MPVTYIIMGVTVIVSLYAFSNHRVFSELMMNPYSIHTRNQYYRFFTSGFIHAHHMHLIMNMISLYFFGAIVEKVFAVYFHERATLYFLLLYFLGIIVSDVPTYFKHRDNPGYNSLGASGGVSSIIFAFILFLPLEPIYLYFAIPIPGFILGILYIVYSYYSGRNSRDNINHDAHLWGALFGLLFCAVMYPQAIPDFFHQIRSWRGFW